MYVLLQNWINNTYLKISHLPTDKNLLRCLREGYCCLKSSEQFLDYRMVRAIF